MTILKPARNLYFGSLAAIRARYGGQVVWTPPPPPPEPGVRFGRDEVFGHFSNTYNDYTYAGRYELVDDNVSLLRIVAAMQDRDVNNVSMKGVLYADDGGLPGALLAVGQSTPVPRIDGSGAVWVTSELATPVTLAAGWYWIGALTDTWGGGIDHTSPEWGHPTNTRTCDDSFTNPAATWPGTYASYEYDLSIYAEYSVP